MQKPNAILFENIPVGSRLLFSETNSLFHPELFKWIKIRDCYHPIKL